MRLALKPTAFLLSQFSGILPATACLLRYVLAGGSDHGISEIELQRELNQPRVIARRSNSTEVTGLDNVTT